MRNSRIYRHEDDTTDSKVFYNLHLEDIESSKPKLHFKIDTLPDEIYHDSKRERVLMPPPSFSFVLEQEQTIDMLTLFVEAVSKYMSDIRRRLHKETKYTLEIEPENSNYKIRFIAVKKRVNHAGKGVNSARLLMKIIDKDLNEEFLVVRLKRTRVVLLLKMIKSLYENYVDKIFVPLENDRKYNVSCMRAKDQFVVGSTWLHGREIQKLQDYIERAVFDFRFKASDGREMFRYRQALAHFSKERNIAELKFCKFNPDHTVYKTKDEKLIVDTFTVHSRTVAVFYLLLPAFIEFNPTDVEVIETSEAEMEISEEISDEEYLLGIKREEKKDLRRITDIDKGNFILNAIESQLVLSVNDYQYNVAQKQGKISLAARYRDFVLTDDEYEVGRNNQELGVYEKVEKLPKCELNLKLDWLHIFSLCAEAVNNSEMIEKDEHGIFSQQWVFDDKSIFGYNHHRLKVLIGEDNKAPAVLLIDRFELEDGDDLAGLSGGQRFRMPLFKEHIRTLIKGLIGVSREFENYYWNKSFPVYSDDYDEITGKMALGLKRFVDKETNEEKVSLGVVGRGLEQVYLTDNDRDLLFFSAYYRLMYGRWLQFSGEQIAISFDGWLTDRFNEYKIEFDMEASQGARGSQAALAMVFATARNRKRELEKTLREVEHVEQ